MEKKLQELISLNLPENRFTWVKKYKDEGKKVLGCMTSQIPEELIYAAGILPFRVTGSWNSDIAKAVGFRTASTCSYCNHILQSVLDGELDCLDGFFVSDKDQDTVRLFDVVEDRKNYKLVEVMHAPMVNSDTCKEFYEAELVRVKAVLEEFIGHEISEEAIASAIKVYNEAREIVAELYELQKQDQPALLGSEMLGITTAAMIMPRDEFVAQMKELLPYIRTRKAPAKCFKPRVMIQSDALDEPEYVKLIEESACVVMDDMDTGRRAFMYPVSTEKEWKKALADHYVGDQYMPRMQNWDEQIRQILDWTAEYRIDGVLSLPLTWCYPQRYRWPLVSRALNDINVPNMSIEREYHFEGAGQLRTRIGAFSEMLLQRKEN